MELSKSQELVNRLKKIKAENEITFPRILDMMEANGKTVSLSTLRRVFANGSDANSFSFENTLSPIAEVLLKVDENQVQIDSAHEKYIKEIDGLKAVVACQNEELVRYHETKELLEGRITFLLEQIAIKDRRLDDKDETIKRLMDKLL